VAFVHGETDGHRLQTEYALQSIREKDKRTALTGTDEFMTNDNAG